MDNPRIPKAVSQNDVYLSYRSLIEHEDILRNHRFTAYLALNAFLATQVKPSQTLSEYAMLALLAFVLCISIIFKFEFEAGEEAMQSIIKEWKSISVATRDDRPIIGLVSRKTIHYSTTTLIICFFWIIWIFVSIAIKQNIFP